MDTDTTSKTPKELSRWVSIGVVLVALALGLVVLYHTNHSPRTDDAEVAANFIGIAPQVEGPIVRLSVHDNQAVKKGDLLFEIDERPYQYALDKAVSEQSALEGQITDERRKIAAQVSAVSVSQAGIHTAQADVGRSSAAIEQARADVSHAEQGVSRAKAEWTYASNNLHRLEPLLAKQFVTVDQVDRAKTYEIAQAEALKQAESQLLLSQASLKATMAQYERSGAALDESKAQNEQARNAVTTLEPLVNQRGARTSAVRGRPLQSRQLPRIRAFRCVGDKPDDFGRGLRACGPADIYADRCADMVGDRQLPRGRTIAHQTWNARRCLHYVETRPPFFWGGRQCEFRSHPRSRSHRAFGSGSSRCATNAQLGTPRVSLSRSCKGRESCAGIVPSG